MAISTPTAILLEQMADGAKFEKLALASLRHLAPQECGTIVHLGINAEGKPIPAPLDGFTQVPWIQPPLFVAVACTTEKTLREKWLGLAKNPRKPKNDKPPKQRDESADVPKAINSAQMLRRRFPTARCKLFLVTNRGIDSDLQPDVATLLDAAQITFEIVECNRLAEFLDLTGSGQFLREFFLNVPAITPSRDLLRECGRRQLADRLHGSDLQDVGNLITRSVEEDIRTACGNTQIALVWLVGDPGKGKSLAACRVMQKHLEADGLVQWMTETDVRHATTLEEAIVHAVSRIKPALRCNDSADLMQFCGPADRVVVLVDACRSYSSCFQRIAGGFL